MILKAGTQYGDNKGSAVADNHDKNDPTNFLREQKLADENEVVVAVDFFSGEVHQLEQNSDVHVTFYVAKSRGDFGNIKEELNQTNTVRVRELRLDMSLQQFFGLFKRFSVTLSSSGLLEGKELTVE
ncbi:hypothetical protein [Idiomarina aminovorans]|uniref:hypothetical protein n=1 Tax=Idiomarina aminovorans TaxID=2914829 RepID=UPI00200419CF|nr:hypothetical protein [Idiomarina sp. ATCH4]MCK7459940.1 hypothetical protein [Idiomarina sp. ATCH4]